MKFKKLTIHNIASIEHAEIDFDAAPLCDERLFLITGETGSGKSTIIDCLCLVLFNNTPRLKAAIGAKYARNRAEDNESDQIQTKDPRQLLRRGTGKAEISLTFEDNNSIPYIARWEVHRARNLVDGAMQPVTRELSTEDGITPAVHLRNSSDINDHITKLIGLDMDQFFRTVVLPQGKFAEFLNSKEDEKSKLLKNITGTEIYEKIGAKIFDVRRDKEREYKALVEELKNITLLTEVQKAEIVEKIAKLSQEQAETGKQRDGAMKMAQWIDDKAKNEQELAQKKQELAQKLVSANEPAQREKQQLVSDWDATSEPRREQKEIQRAEQQMQLLQEQVPAMQEEFDDLCAALRAKEEHLAADLKKLDEIENFLKQEAPNSDMYKSIKGIQSLLKQRKDEQNNTSAFTIALQQEEKRKPQVEADVKQTFEAQEQQDKHVKQLEADYEKMDVEGINREMNAINEATLALTQFKAANDAVVQTAATCNGFTTERENTQQELEKWLAVVEEQRARKEETSKAVERETDWNNLLQQAHKSLHKGETCPVCGNIIQELKPPKGKNELDELRNKLDRATHELQDTEAKIIAAKRSIEQVSKRINESQKELSAKKAARDEQWQLTSQRLEKCGKIVDKMAENAVADLIINDLNKRASELQNRLEQATDLQRKIKAERDRLDLLTKAHTNTQLQLNKVNESIKSQREAIGISIKRVESLTQQLDSMFTMTDWQEQMTKNSGFIEDLTHKATEFQQKEEFAQQLKSDISITRAVIPGMRGNKQNIVGLTDNGKTSDKIPRNLEELWRQFENKNIEWNNRLNNERQNAKRAKTALDNYLSENPAMTVERLMLLGQHQQSEIDTIRQAIESLKNAITRMEGEIVSLNKRHQDIVACRPDFAEDNREILDNIIQTSQSRHQELTDLIAELKADIKTDEEKQKRVGEKNEAKEKAKAVFEQWDELSNDLGDDKGKNFLRIAQSYLLGELLNTANGYLRQFNNRYELEANPGSLVILARDQLQGDLTSVNTLSGGESFMVSLALALALSSTSGRIFSVDTLFIDEGFGSLSDDYLEKVMETLNRLYEIGGRRIGIISHVEALKKSVTTQIQVTRDQGNTTVSRVDVVIV